MFRGSRCKFLKSVEYSRFVPSARSGASRHNRSGMENKSRKRLTCWQAPDMLASSPEGLAHHTGRRCTPTLGHSSRAGLPSELSSPTCPPVSGHSLRCGTGLPRELSTATSHVLRRLSRDAVRAQATQAALPGPGTCPLTKHPAPGAHLSCPEAAACMPATFPSGASRDPAQQAIPWVPWVP